MTSLADGPVFGHGHILLTALTTALITAGFAAWRLGRARWIDILGVAVTAGLSVLAFRTAANMPELNNDGFPMFSANDMLSPVVTYVFLSVYRALRPQPHRALFDQSRALATVTSLAVNVITI